MTDRRKISVRAASPDDAKALRDIYAYYVQSTAVSFEYDAPSTADFKSRMEKTLEKYPFLVAEAGGEPLGFAYTGPFAARAAYGWAAETSVYLRRDKRGAGLGRALYEALERVSRAQNLLSLNACIACPEPEDEYLTLDSLRFHERMGFSPAARFHSCGYKFGRWYDMVWMEKMLGVHGPEPLPVIPFPALPPDILKTPEK